MIKKKKKRACRLSLHSGPYRFSLSDLVCLIGISFLYLSLEVSDHVMKGRRGASVELSLIDHYWCPPPCHPVTQPDTWTWELGSPGAGELAGWVGEELGSPGAISHSSLSFALRLQSGSDLVLRLLPVEGLGAIEISTR